MNDKKSILLVSATLEEINPFLKKCKTISQKENFIECLYANIKIDFLITGIGMPFTVFHLTKHLSGNIYSLIINTGIAGSFKKNIEIGSVVHVINDSFSDLGIENEQEFLTIFEENLYSLNTFPFTNGELINKNFINNPVIDKIKWVKGITVNKVHGSQKSIEAVINKFNPDIETMEGAAFFYVCQSLALPCYQIRSISNMVESRNKDNWNIPLAINNLNKIIHNVIDWGVQHNFKHFI
ncbi:MAG: futalosine hydrolase [Chlorobi bacterium]|nr:futalosine hydrolase [Chlorobiota bacterium]